MANRVLSIEVGNEITHVIETDFKVKSPKIYKSFSFETSQDMLLEDAMTDCEEFKRRLCECLEKNKIKTKRVVFTIESSRIASRDVIIPHVKENRILTLLKANSAEYFPVNLEEYQLSYRILGEVTEKNEKKHKLMVLAVPNDLIKAYQGLAEKCELLLTALDYVGNATTQIMRNLIEKKLYAAVKIEEDTTMISIIKDGNITLQRNFSYGIEDAITVIQKSEVFGNNITFLQGLDIMRSKECIHSEQNDSEHLLEVKEDVTESYRAIVGNISRVMNFYTSNNAGEEIEEVILYGTGADIKGLTELLTEELNVNVASDALIEKIQQEKSDENEAFYPLEYLSCMGAVMNPMNFKLEETEEKEKKGKNKEERTAMFYARRVMYGCIIAAIVLLLAVVPRYIYLKVKINQMQQEKQKQDYLAKEYDEYKDVKDEYDKLTELYGATKTTSNDLGAFIKEMEAKMPSDIQVRSFTSDSGKATLEIQVSTKKEAAKILNEFAEFESISKVSTTAIEETRDELNQPIVNFIVECTYVGGTEDEDAQTKTTVTEDVNTLSNNQAEQ